MARRPFLPALALAVTALVLLARPGGAATPNPPNDEEFGRQSALKAVKAPEAWAKGTGGGIKVAVVSTGIAKGHPDLQGKVGGGFDATGDDAGTDVDGRGTHLAGIVAAVTNNGPGIAAVAPDAQVLPFKAFESGDTLDADAYLLALQKAGASAPVVLVDLSAGFPEAKEGKLLELLGAMAGQGVSVVVGVQGGIPLASLPVLVAYPTSAQAGERGVVAPANVLSTTVTGATLPGDFDYGYGEKSGSNRSAALVAGAVAILRGAGANSNQAADALRATKVAGAGTIDVAAAVNAFTTPPPPPAPVTTVTTKKPVAPPTTKPGSPSATLPSGLSDTAGFTGPALPAEPVEPVELGEGEEAVVPPGAEELLELDDSGGGGSEEEDDRPLGLLALGFGMLCGVGSGLSLTFRRLAGPPL